MIDKIKINDFRQFKNNEIYLGKRLTILAGRNSTGKSTILGLLANCAEIKKKDGVTYSGQQFRAEFSEIFHGSEEFDKSGSNKIRINVVDANGNNIDYRDFRTAWQNVKNKKRFRIIPFKKVENKKITESKMSFPVLYLGLSRLYPIGEVEKNNIESNEIKFHNSEDNEWFIEKYKYILSINDEIKEIDNFKISETNKKVGVAVTTNNYDEFTNSSGQDNLGQILIALLSFKKLKTDNPERGEGGLLLIDEVDSTLHPAAQKRLIDLIQKEAEKIGIQAVITTHSSDLLKHVCSKTKKNSKDKANEIEVYYFTNANKKLEIKRNLNFLSIKNDLLLESVIESEKISVYSEDAENRWFLKNLLKQYMMYLKILETNIGCEQLLNLYSVDQNYFGNVLIVLDGDVKSDKIDKLPQIDRLKNIIKLPGEVRPEEVIYKYIISLNADHPFWEKAENLSVSWQYVKDNSPNSPKYSGFAKERDKYKKWFQDNESWLNSLNIFEFWSRDNEEMVNEFLKSFIVAYNSIAERNFYTRIEQ
ncbi:ATP-binding protein [Fusobacterium nucleatum]|uniref:AAA family ATPase n=1 Tax=Fusobacterium nucleatum TaxID=851 RepID=UPI003CFC71ED